MWACLYNGDYFTQAVRLKYLVVYQLRLLSVIRVLVSQEVPFQNKGLSEKVFRFKVA